MTAPELLAYICAALLLQLTAGIALIARRKRALNESTWQPEPAARSTNAGAWSGWRDFRVIRRVFEDVANTQCSFYLQPVDGVPLSDFKPGQYLTFSLPVIDTAGGSATSTRSLIRCYSLSDRPDPASYRITIKRIPHPRDRPDLPPGASSTHLLDRVHEGDILRVRAPSGHFYLDPDAAVSAVFIAGGIGITPIISMLRWSVAAQPERRVHLYYGVRSSADHAFKQLLEEMATSYPALKLHVVYSCPGLGDVSGRDYQHVGYVDLELLRSSLPHGRHQFYVCGPPPMMKSLVPALRAWGVDESDIHFEAFGPASVQPSGPAATEPMAAPSASFEVRLSRSGRTLVWDGQDANLLDFTERHGVLVESGCRSGSCGTCETGLTSGDVSYLDRPDYDIAPGHCLLCVGKPQSALELEA